MRFNLDDLNRLPDIYGQENIADPIVYERIYIPGTQYTAYLTEYSDVAPDGYPHLGFGYVSNGGPSQFDELGYVSLDEMLQTARLYGLGVERDENWKPVPLSELKQQLEREQRGFDMGMDL